MKAKKLTVWMLSAAMAVSAMAGSGMTAFAEDVVSEPVELDFIFADGDEGAKASINQIVSDFNEAHPNITVNIVPGNGGAYSEFLKTKDSVGEFPDVMEMRDTAMYVRAGKLAELPEEITSLFISTFELDGKVYTAPLAGENTQGIIYNKTYFDENGWTEPTTYEEFITLCQNIKDQGDMAPLVVGGQDIWHMGFLYHKAYNDQVLSADPDFIKHCYEGTKDFSDPAIAATFDELKEIFQYAQEGWVSTPDAQITTFLVNDMAAMMYSGTHMFSQISKVRLVGGAGIGGLAISAEAAEDPNKAVAAQEFIKFFFSPDEYKVYCEKLSAIPVTVESPQIEADAVFQEVIDIQSTADDLAPMWNGKAGENELPPDFRNFTYKTLIEYLTGQREMESCATELNNTWQVGMQSFNPITGVGIN